MQPDQFCVDFILKVLKNNVLNFYLMYNKHLLFFINQVIMVIVLDSNEIRLIYIALP